MKHSISTDGISARSRFQLSISIVLLLRPQSKAPAVAQSKLQWFIFGQIGSSLANSGQEYHYHDHGAIPRQNAMSGLMIDVVAGAPKKVPLILGNPQIMILIVVFIFFSIIPMAL